MSEPLTLYTIGHSNLAADDFLALLHQHDITLLVDIRTTPASRYFPHFGKKRMETWLPENRIEYRFAGDNLGGRPKDESVYQGDKVDYAAMMGRDWYQQGIAELVDLVREMTAAERNVAIMCSEGDPKNCHRHHLIARSLLDSKSPVATPDIEIRHILKGGNLTILDDADFKDSLRQPPLM